MKLEVIALQGNNKVMQSYNEDKEFLHTFFDYGHEESSYSERLAELAGRPFEDVSWRKRFVSFMEPFGISASADKAH